MKNNKFNNLMSSIELDKESADRIVGQCRMGQRAKNIRIRFSRQIAAAFALGMCVLVPCTAHAAVNAYQSYMERMSTSEIQERVQRVQDGEKQADSFSRELSESERDRMQILRKQYEEGICFPSTSMVMVDGTLEDLVTQAVPYYDYKQMIFHIADTELTDDELLQIIDVWEKANYSLARNETKEGHVTGDEVENAIHQMEEWKNPVSCSDEEIIMENSKALLGEVAQIDLSNVNWQISYYGEAHQRYLAQAKNDDVVLSVTYEEDCPVTDLIAYSMRFSHNANIDTSVKATYTEYEAKEMITNKAEELLPVMKKYFGLDEDVSCYRYGYLSDSMTHYIIEYKDDCGNRYRCTVSFADNEVREILKYDAGRYDDIDIMEGLNVLGDSSMAE